MGGQIELASVKKLQEKLAADECFQRYRKLGENIHQNKELQALYNDYLQLQKEAVNASHYQLLGVTAEKEASLRSMEEKLFAIPVFAEYMQLQVELEELLQILSFLIETQVNEILAYEK